MHDHGKKKIKWYSLVKFGTCVIYTLCTVLHADRLNSQRSHCCQHKREHESKIDLIDKRETTFWYPTQCCVEWEEMSSPDLQTVYIVGHEYYVH